MRSRRATSAAWRFARLLLRGVQDGLAYAGFFSAGAPFGIYAAEVYTQYFRQGADGPGPDEPVVLPPGHPERAAGDVPPTEEELRLWAGLSDLRR